MSGYPLLLDVAGRRVLVVGAGPVAARRAKSLVGQGARVHVVAAYACEDVWELASTGHVTLQLREFVATDVEGMWLVHTATGDPVVDQSVDDAAHAQRIWCVRADDAAKSSAWTPAVTQIAGLTVAVNAGGDPARARTVRNAIAEQLHTGALPIRHHRTGYGTVALVGGGPGDPGLISTRGRVLLAEADVVIIDRLAPRALLDELNDEVEVIDAGKAPHAHTLSQDEINELLVERAQRGKRVVRLKGGDPFVLGRGSEEARACRNAGVDVEVVPGITSAIAVPAAAGIPLTERGVTSRFTVVSGHDGPLDFRALAALDGTLVFLMGVAHLPQIVRQLTAHGRRPDEPVAVIERGTTPQQRVTIGDLGSIAQRAKERHVAPPAVVVVGDVVASRLPGGLE